MTYDDDELSALLAAYALDALDDTERAAVEDALATSPRARAELARLEAVAGLLGEAASVDELPEGSWERLAARLDRPGDPLAAAPAAAAPAVPPLAPPPSPPSLPSPPSVADLDAARDRRARRRGTAGRGLAGRGLAGRGLAGRWTTGVAAAAAVVALVLGVVVLRQRGELDDLRARPASPAEAAAAALARPGSRVATLSSSDSAVQVRAVVDDAGTAYVFADALPALPAGRTYQLWTLDAAQPVSLGVLGDRPAVVAVPASSGLRRLAITAEAAPGATAPTSTPIVAGTLA
jgi:anti-sigma-K factor RskA